MKRDPILIDVGGQILQFYTLPPLKNEIFTAQNALGQVLLLRIAEMAKTALCDEADKEKRTILYTLRRVAVAASIVLLIGVVTFYTDTVESGNVALIHHFEDGTVVWMQPGARLSYRPFLWRIARMVTLKGTARFTVEKGSPFSVKTALAEIVVLGTTFRVEQSEGLLSVDCSSGVVAVEVLNETLQLTAGEGLRFDGKQVKRVTTIQSDLQPPPEVIEFVNAPVESVFGKIEEVFGVTLINNSIPPNSLYTGVLITNDLHETLTIVLGVFNMDYSQQNDSIYLFLKK